MFIPHDDDFSCAIASLQEMGLLALVNDLFTECSQYYFDFGFLIDTTCFYSVFNSCRFLIIIDG